MTDGAPGEKIKKKIAVNTATTAAQSSNSASQSTKAKSPTKEKSPTEKSEEKFDYSIFDEEYVSDGEHGKSLANWGEKKKPIEMDSLEISEQTVIDAMQNL